ncbi:hypothetical protein [Streptomyces mirabilis]|uniref:hypothetical protein n=2 Tax=Streptomyces mirabilis TaxID=68239 RepID=UPI0033284B5C
MLKCPDEGDLCTQGGPGGSEISNNDPPSRDERGFGHGRPGEGILNDFCCAASEPDERLDKNLFPRLRDRVRTQVAAAIDTNGYFAVPEVPRFPLVLVITPAVGETGDRRGSGGR